MSTAARAGDDGRTNPFSFAVIAALLAIGIVTFGAFLVLAAYAPDLRGDTRGDNSALSKSAVGFAGLIRLLRAEDVPATVSRVAPAGARSSLLVLTPLANGQTIPMPLLRGSTVATLVVLPKWRGVESAEHPGWVDKAGLLDVDVIAKALPVHVGLWRARTRTAVLHGGSGRMEAIDALKLGRIDSLQTIGISTDWTPVLMDEAGEAVLVRLSRSGELPTYVLSDPDLLNTQGLRDIDTARAAVAIIDNLREGGPVTFDVTLDGLGRSPSLLRLLFEPPLLGATLCAVGCGLLILIMALHRFGPAARTNRALDFGKRALADNAAGLIALAGREIHMAVPYAQLTRALVIKDIGAPARPEGRGMDAFLDAASVSRGLSETYTDLATAAGDVMNRATLTDVTLRLHQWSRGMRRGHR